MRALVEVSKQLVARLDKEDRSRALTLQDLRSELRSAVTTMQRSALSPPLSSFLSARLRRCNIVDGHASGRCWASKQDLPRNLSWISSQLDPFTLAASTDFLTNVTARASARGHRLGRRTGCLLIDRRPFSSLGSQPSRLFLGIPLRVGIACEFVRDA